MQRISIQEVEYLAHVLAKELMRYDEPIPEFTTRFPNALESCLAVPFQRFSGKSVYPGLLKKTSVLFYLMIKNHLFQNGNKRVAVATLLVFLYKNNQWIEVDAQALHNFAKWVAESPRELKDEMLAGIEKFITRYLIADRSKARQ